MAITYVMISVLLVAAQIAATWYVGWRGLFGATVVDLVLVWVCGNLYWHWWDAQYGKMVAEGLRLEEAMGFGMLQGYTACNVLLAAIVLATSEALGAMNRRAR